MKTLYGRGYLMQETKKPRYIVMGKNKCCYKYLDLWELEPQDLPLIIDRYPKHAIRYNGKWFFVKSAKTYFTTYQQQQNAPQYWIKYLYERKKHPILKDGTIGI